MILLNNLKAQKISGLSYFTTKKNKYLILFKSILLLSSLIYSLSGFAQNSTPVVDEGVLIIFGKVKYNGKKLSGVNVTLELNSKELLTTQTNKKGKYSVNLQLHKEYNLRFHKEGFVSKTVSFKTRVPDTFDMHKFEYRLDINLESILEEN